MLVLKLLCVWHIFLCLLYYKQVFLLFLFFFFLVKVVIPYDNQIIVLGTLYLLQENILHHFHRNFFMKSSLKSDKYSLYHINPFTGNFWDKLFASKYVRYDDSIFFIIILHAFIICFGISMCRLTHSSSNTFFNH